YGIDKFREQYVNVEGNYVSIGRWWNVVQGILIPAQAAVLLAWFFWQTYPTVEIVAASRGIPTAEVTTIQLLGEWLPPIAVEHTGTVLVQWAVVLAVVLAANRVLGRLAHGRAAGE